MKSSKIRKFRFLTTKWIVNDIKIIPNHKSTFINNFNDKSKLFPCNIYGLVRVSSLAV